MDPEKEAKPSKHKVKNNHNSGGSHRDSNSPNVKKIRNTIYIVVLIIVIVAVLAIKPDILGYSIAENNDPLAQPNSDLQILKQDIAEVKTGITQYAEVNKEVESQRLELANQLIECKDQTRKLTTDVEEKNKECVTREIAAEERQLDRIVELEEELATVKEALDEFDSFSANMARSVCCKQKVDNSAISGFEVINNKLVCMEGSGNALSC